MSERGQNKYLKFRGDLRGLFGREGVITFATAHPEGQTTAIYRADTEKWKLSSEALPCGVEAVVADAESLFIVGTDGLLYKGAVAGGALAPLSKKSLSPEPRELVLVGDKELATISGSQVVVIERVKGKEVQRLDLPEEGTALACDPSGTWIVAGTSKGGVFVFDREDKKGFMAGDSGKLHQGAVTALCFEPEELRFLSAGVDNALLLTHARGGGKLEPENRAGSAAHKKAVTVILNHPDGEVFYTSGLDAELKVWTRGQKRPKTFSSKDGVGRAVGATIVDVAGRPHLALACEGNTIRLFLLDAAGKVSHRALVLKDAIAWAKSRFVPLLKIKENERGQVLDELHGWADSPAVDLLASRAVEDGAHKLRVKATELLGSCGHPRAAGHLEGLLRNDAEAVRLAAFAGLRSIKGEGSLHPLELGLSVGKADIGLAAVKALGGLAAKDDIAQARLVKALSDEPREVRFEALLQLEALLPNDSPQAELTALEETSFADLRWAAILRCHERKLLDKQSVLSVLRRHSAEQDAPVRQIAFMVSLLSRPTLAAVLRGLDSEIHRQLHQIETHGEEVDSEAKLPKPKKVAPKELQAEDYTPLLEAQASRALDTCLRGAWCLALLKDPRAFGTLLQLSREQDVAARVEACQSFEKLGDPRGLQRLRLLLRDPEAQVRDAAFTAISRLLSKEPLEAAEAGLVADAEDVRSRGLKLLSRQLKKGLPKEEDHKAYTLLERALNDSAASVRGEAFKATVNLELFGGGAAALRFALRSLHADIRREVLTEVMGEIEQDWSWDLLLECFDDLDESLRKEAFEFARKKSKGRALQPLERALTSAHADLRLEAVLALAKKVQDETLTLLVSVLDDDEQEVRLQAIGALETAEAEEHLVKAMESRQADVRIRAATACAELGNRAALEPLLTQLAEPEPEVSDLQKIWKDLVIKALNGLAVLGVAEGVAAATPLLDHKERELREAAGKALAWCVPMDDTAPLKAALQHSCTRVKSAAALGLAWLGDPLGASLIFPDQTQSTTSSSSSSPTKKGAVRKVAKRKVAKKKSAPSASVFTPPEGISIDEALIASMTLGTRELFVAFLDHSNAKIRGRAMRLLMLSEWCENDGVPDRCLDALASADGRVRLLAARALESFHDVGTFGAFVGDLLGDRGDNEQQWTLDEEVITSLAEAVVHGQGRLRARAAMLLELLEEAKRDAFDRAWRRFATRFDAELKELSKAASARKAPKMAYSAETLAQLVFGAYVGLSRMSGGYATARVRQTAIARLRGLVDSGRIDAAISAPTFVQALSDDNRDVRVLAFEALEQTGYDSAKLSAEALGTSQRDVAVLGLKLLSGGEKGKKTKEGKKGGDDVLAEVLLGRTDGLEEEAAKLLAERIGWPRVHERSLEARSERLRNMAVHGLNQLYEKEKEAQKLLRKALTSRFRHVRSLAASCLAQKRDGSAFDVLVELTKSAVQNEQIKAINDLLALGDIRAVDVFLDRIENDPAGTARVPQLFGGAGAFRAPETTDRLFKLLEEKKTRGEAWKALVTISGYDQWLNVNWDDPTDESWLEKQQPRHDAVLARLLEAGSALGETTLVRNLIQGATWAKSSEIDGALTPLSTATDDALRREALWGIGWRLRHRDGTADPLIAALAHKDPTAQFLGAEGLALAGRAEGITVLLATVDTMDDLNLRRRSVTALGKLADERAFDLLLRLVNEDGHALQDEAAEAIGHLAKSDKADTIFELLKRLAASAHFAGERALVGLRWFDTAEAWQIIRDSVHAGNWRARAIAAELLRYNDDPSSRELLVSTIIESDDWSIVRTAAMSLRFLDGAESLEPDYVFVRSGMSHLEEDTVERLRERGEPGRLLEVLPKIHEHNDDIYFSPLVSALLSREPLPVKEAARALEEPHEKVLEVSARILGHAGAKSAAKHGKSLENALSSMMSAWETALTELHNTAPDELYQAKEKLEVKTSALRWLAWACGRLKGGDKELIAAATLGGNDLLGKPVRAVALTSLSEGIGGKEALEVLASAAVGSDAELRNIAASALSKLDPGRATTLVEQALDDRTSLDRLLAGNDDAKAVDVLRGAASKVHVQGAALPHLVARGDTKGLTAALADRKLPEAARLGALEGLARLAAEEPILEVARDEKEEESLRKAAWRAVRRARRIKNKAGKAQKQGEVSR